MVSTTVESSGAPGRVRRGTLTVYLGAAPGVGKTYAMLGEAHRRRARGTDVVVGLVETHGRSRTAAQLEGLEVVPPRQVAHRDGAFPELDVDAVLARRPEVVLVDELAHTCVPGSPRERRVDDVEVLRAAGVDVVTTLNVQHLESLNDEVRRITGVRQRETVPDAVVRAADQIQLVDMAPEALRRRLAHGNVYAADRVDASLASYFRVGNLTALRELALLWLADRVDDALGDYRRAHRIAEPWPARERVVVAVTGGAESEALLRRGARLASRSGGSDLVAVHVVASDGLVGAPERRLDQVQRLVADLGGTFHTVVAEDVARGVVDFALAANATMVLVGVSRHGRLRRLTTGSTGDRIARLAGGLDVHLVTHDEVARTTWRRRGPLASPLARSRQLTGWLLALLLPAAVTVLLGGAPGPDPDRLALAELLLLVSAVVVALVGGLWPALLGAGLGFVLLNWFFTEPTGALLIDDHGDVAALAAFLVVAVGVARVVDLASRRAEEATRARAEAATLAALSQSVLTGADTAEAICARVRDAFGQDEVVLEERAPAGWVRLAAAGAGHDGPAAGSGVAVDDTHRLVLRGPAVPARDRRLLEAFAVQAGLVLEYRRLRDRDQRTAALESAQSTSTALLRAVSHDLRTPLATVRAGVDALLTGPGPEDRAELLGTVAGASDRLEHLVDDLLDLSRVQSGLVRARVEPRSLEEVLPLAVAGHGDLVRLEVDEDLPWVSVDAGLLERVVANLVANAVRAAAGEPVRVLAHVLPARVEVLVVDRGPGVPVDRRQQIFEPFQRLGDGDRGRASDGGAATGLGLGLAVARGLAEAAGATVEPEDTPGGGLTMVLSLPRAEPEQGGDVVGTVP